MDSVSGRQATACSRPASGSTTRKNAGVSSLSQSVVSEDAAFDARRSGSTPASAAFYPLTPIASLTVGRARTRGRSPSPAERLRGIASRSLAGHILVLSPDILSQRQPIGTEGLNLCVADYWGQVNRGHVCPQLVTLTSQRVGFSAATPTTQTHCRLDQADIRTCRSVPAHLHEGHRQASPFDES